MLMRRASLVSAGRGLPADAHDARISGGSAGRDVQLMLMRRASLASAGRGLQLMRMMRAFLEVSWQGSSADVHDARISGGSAGRGLPDARILGDSWQESSR